VSDRDSLFFPLAGKSFYLKKKHAVFVSERGKNPSLIAGKMK